MAMTAAKYRNVAKMRQQSQAEEENYRSVMAASRSGGSSVKALKAGVTLAKCREMKIK
jgi:hypothetical protein